MTVRLLSDANYYLFNIKGNNEPLNIKSEKYNRVHYLLKMED